MESSDSENDKIKMLLEQMNKQQQQAKPLGQQSMGGGLLAPSKTDMGPIGGMADAVGAINPIAGAASKALLGGVEAASGAIGGVLDAPFRAIERIGRSIKGLRPIPPGDRAGAQSSAGSKMLGGGADLVGALVKQAGSTSASSQPPPSLSEPQQGSADWKPSPEANRIAIASAISPGSGLSQWSGEIGPEQTRPPQGVGGFGEKLPPSDGQAVKTRQQILAEEERRRQELMNQYNPYARRGINPG